MENRELLKTGDRVTVTLRRDGWQNEDGLSGGSHLVTKSGAIEVKEYAPGRFAGWVKFDDGDLQATEAYTGPANHPVVSISRETA